LIGIRHDGASGGIVSGCNVRDLADTAFAVGIHEASDGKVTGCGVKDIDTTGGVAYGIHTQSPAVTIANNVIDNIDNTGTAALGIGIYTGASATEDIISNNTTKNCSGTGIVIEVDESNINGNTSVDNGVNGILIQANSDNNMLSGNICNNNGSRGIYIAAATEQNNVVTGNRATGNTTANFTDSGTGTTDSGNDWN